MLHVTVPGRQAFWPLTRVAALIDDERVFTTS
jgi:hypothetical protein